MKDRFVYVVGFVFLITFLVAGALSAMNLVTRDRIAENGRIRYKEAVLLAMGLRDTDREDIEEMYARAVQTPIQTEMADVLYAKHLDGVEIVAIPFVGPGVWGDITGIIAMDRTLGTIIGLSILDQNETPGLGGRITEIEFLDQFAGEQVSDVGITLARGTGDTDPMNATIDGISGATGSSRAITGIVNQAIATLREVAADVAG